MDPSILKKKFIIYFLIFNRFLFKKKSGTTFNDFLKNGNFGPILFKIDFHTCCFCGYTLNPDAFSFCGI